MLELVPLREGFAVRRAIVSLCSSAVFVLAMSTSGVAFGQWEADRATARNLAAEGNAALNIGDFATAEDRFRRADALVHAPTLVVDHAKSLIGLHRYVEAQERLELVIREGVSENVPWVWKRAVQDAKALVEEVKPKIAWVTISVTGSSNPEVSVDGVQVPVAALGVRRATDPGPHRIKAMGTGLLKKEIILPVSEGSERAVTLDLQPDPAALQSTNEAPSPQTPPPQKNPTPAKESKSLFSATNVGYAAIGLGGAGLIVGAVTGVIFLGKQSDIHSKCPNRSNCLGLVSQSEIDQRNMYGTISGVSLGVGVVSGTAGVVLLLLRDKSDTTAPKRTSSITMTPCLTLGHLGVEGTFQ